MLPLGGAAPLRPEGTKDWPWKCFVHVTRACVHGSTLLWLCSHKSALTYSDPSSWLAAGACRNCISKKGLKERQSSGSLSKLRRKIFTCLWFEKSQTNCPCWDSVGRLTAVSALMVSSFQDILSYIWLWRIEGQDSWQWTRFWGPALSASWMKAKFHWEGKHFSI